MYEQDYVMRFIKEMVRAILKLLFNIDAESPTVELLENKEEKETLKNLLDMCNAPLNIIEGMQILENLRSNKLISNNEANLLKSTISTKALNNPLNMEEILRANILKEIIIELMKRR